MTAIKEALEKIIAGLSCGGTDNSAHYCPNCDNSLFNVQEIARSALADIEGAGKARLPPDKQIPECEDEG